MSTCTADRAPVFWQPQPRLPVPVMRFLRLRLEAALDQPADRALLAWPTVLGAPGVRAQHPDGVPEEVLLQHAERMMRPYGVGSMAEAWARCRAEHPDTARVGETGWLPGEAWEAEADQVSLRCGVILLSLLGHPEAPEAYRLSAGIALFNSALFHECHDALEGLWQDARGHLKKGLQGLILLAGGFYHQQVRHVPGMVALWEDALPILAPLDGELETPWGTVSFLEALQAVEVRLGWLEGQPDAADPGPLWTLPRPRLERR